MVHVHVLASCVHAQARIFTKNFLVVIVYFLSLSLKFREDPSFRWGDIPLFVTLYDLELKKILFSKPPKNAILNSKKRTLRFIFLNFFFDNKHYTPFIWWTKKTVWKPTFIGLTQVSRVNRIWGNHRNIFNGVTVLVNISHIFSKCKERGSFWFFSKLPEHCVQTLPLIQRKCLQV